MALIKCPECGKEVSDHAASCPNCGYPISDQANERIPAKGSHFADNSQKSLEPAESDADVKRSKNLITGLILAASFVAVIFICVYLVTPRYSGLAQNVAQQVGYISDGSDGPKVKVAVSIWPRLEEGEDSTIMWDTKEEFIVGYAHFSQPVSRSYSGTVEIIGIVDSCDGSSSLDLKDAQIVE